MNSERRWKLTTLVSDYTVLEDWINLHRENWFNNPKNSFYGYEDRARAIAEYWLTHGEFGPDYNDHNIIRLEGYWRDWVTEVWQEVNQ